MLVNSKQIQKKQIRQGRLFLELWRNEVTGKADTFKQIIQVKIKWMDIDSIILDKTPENYTKTHRITTSHI